MDEHAKSLQEIFNRAYLGVLAQGGQSSDTGGRCMYRGPEGRKCAVGHLLPDELYRPSMEGMSVGYCPRVLQEALLRAGIDMRASQTKALVQQMQTIHDDYHSSEYPFTEYLKTEMGQLAKKFNLEIPK